MAAVLPSRAWFGLGSRLWELLPARDRAVFVAYLALPALNRIAALASFGLTVRLIHHSMTHHLTPQQEILAGIGIFAAFAFASLLFWAAERCELSLKGAFLRLVREVAGRRLLMVRELSGEERESAFRKFYRRTPELVRKSSDMLFDFSSLCANSVLIVVLSSVILLVSPLVGAVMVLGGLTFLLGMRVRSPRGGRVGAEGGTKRATEELRKAAWELACGEVSDEEALDRYRRNELDRLQQEGLSLKRARRGKVLALVGFGTAVLMSVLFFLAAEGWFDEMDPIWILVLVLAVRTCVAHGRMALEKWSSLLSQRTHLGRFRQMVMEVT